MSDGVRVVIEDDPALGPWYCPLPTGRIPLDLTLKSLFVLPSEQVADWERVRLEWERVQREMVDHLRQRDRELIALIGRHAGPREAEKAEKRLGRRRRRS